MAEEMAEEMAKEEMAEEKEPTEDDEQNRKVLDPNQPKIVKEQPLSSRLEKDFTKADPMSSSYAFKTLLLNLFNDPNWKTFNVYGNGLCLYYAIMAADNNEYICSFSDRLINDFIDFTILGITKIFEAQQKFINTKTSMPDTLSNAILLEFFVFEEPKPKLEGETDEEYNEILARYTINKKLADESRFYIIKDDFDENIFKKNLKTILNLKEFANLPTEMIKIFAYAKQCNILYFGFENPGLSVMFYPCIMEITNKYADKTIIVFNKAGHFYPIFHSSNDIKKTITDKIIMLTKKTSNPNYARFRFDNTQVNFITENREDKKSLTFDAAIQEAEAAIALELKPAAEPPAAEPPEPAPEKTLVQKLLKKQMIDYFKERKKRIRKKGEEGG